MMCLSSRVYTIKFSTITPKFKNEKVEHNIRIQGSKIKDHLVSLGILITKSNHFQLSKQT